MAGRSAAGFIDCSKLCRSHEGDGRAWALATGRADASPVLAQQSDDSEKLSGYKIASNLDGSLFSKPSSTLPYAWTCLSKNSFGPVMCGEPFNACSNAVSVDFR